jgi:hypothetical protein
MTKQQTDELAELKARVADLERAAKPAPATPAFKPDLNYRPVNPIDRLSMPPSVVREMAAAVPDSMVRGILRDSRAPSGPSQAGSIPSSQQVSNVRGAGTGWAREIPLGPSPHQRYVDAQLDAQDAKDKAERLAQAAQLAALDPKP